MVARWPKYFQFNAFLALALHVVLHALDCILYWKPDTILAEPTYILFLNSAASQRIQSDPSGL
jgi:hypothetical protein